MPTIAKIKETNNLAQQSNVLYVEARNLVTQEIKGFAMKIPKNEADSSDKRAELAAGFRLKIMQQFENKMPDKIWSVPKAKLTTSSIIDEMRKNGRTVERIPAPIV